MQRLLIDVHALAARWWDPERLLLTTPRGRHERTMVTDRQFGLLLPTVWWAYGLLRRDAPGDRELAGQALEGVLSRQLRAAGRAWNGSWPATSEERPPPPGAVAFVDYDPDQRVVVATALALLLRDHDLPTGLSDAVRDAVVLAVRSEPAGRIDASWTHLAAQLAWVELEVASWLHDGPLLARGVARARAVVEDTAGRGHVAEHGSPTDTGLVLYALSLWGERPPVDELAALGTALRDELWQDLLAAWHPGLSTLIPPFSRADGMDLRAHAAAAAPWLTWLVDGAYPFPPLTESTVHQGNVLPLAFVVDALAGAGASVLEMAPLVRAQPARQGPWIDSVSGRSWTGWTGPSLAIGAESSPVDWGGWWQTVTAAAIWDAGNGHNAWLRLHPARGAVDARVVVDGGEVLLVHEGTDAPLSLLVGGVAPDELTRDHLVAGGRHWTLHGVAAIELVEPRSAPDALCEAVLTLEADVGRVVLSTLAV